MWSWGENTRDAEHRHETTLLRALWGGNEPAYHAQINYGPISLSTRPLTSDFPSKLTNLYKCWSFMQFQTGAGCLWKPTHFHVSIWMGMVVGGRLPIIEKQGCLRETFMLFLFLDWRPIVNQHQYFFDIWSVLAILMVSETTGTARKPEHTKTVIEITWYCHCLVFDNVASVATV